MPDRVVDLRLFRYALASAEHGSFRRAAAALNVQQSTVSKGILTLEHRLGATLFERSHSGIQPTPSGDRFLRDASLGFDHLAKAMQRVKAVQRGEHGELAVVVSLPIVLLGDILGRFREQYQAVMIEIAESTCTAGHASVRMRKVDVAFVTKPATDDLARSLHLRDERINVVLPTSHRLAGAREILLQDLLVERFILGASGLGPELAAHIRGCATAVGRVPNIQLHKVGDSDLIGMVAQGFGVTVVVGRPSHTAPDGVVLVPLADGNVVSVHALWADTNPNPALKGLLGILERSSAPRLPNDRS